MTASLMDLAPKVVSIEAVIRLLQRSRFDLSSEKHVQEGVATVLSAAGILFDREKRLSPRDIPDFFLAGGVVLECKMRNKSKKVDVFKQLRRYAACPEVTTIVLVSNIAMGLPPELLGKPVYVASLSHGWM
jgi:hypothetical protein